MDILTYADVSNKDCVTGVLLGPAPNDTLMQAATFLKLKLSGVAARVLASFSC